MKRIQTYTHETKPIIEYYDEKNLVKSIDANRSPDDVFEQVKKIFNEVEAKDIV